MSDPIVEMPPTPDQAVSGAQWPEPLPVAAEPAPETQPALIENPNRHSLPSGGWVELRDLSTLKARDHKQILRGINQPDVTRVMAFGVDMTDGLMSVMITAWSLPYGADWAIPALCVMRDAETGTPVVLDNLQAADYAKLEELIRPAQKILFPGKADPTDAEDPASPTGPANA